MTNKANVTLGDILNATVTNALKAPLLAPLEAIKGPYIAVHDAQETGEIIILKIDGPATLKGLPVKVGNSGKNGHLTRDMHLTTVEECYGPKTADHGPFTVLWQGDVRRLVPGGFDDHIWLVDMPEDVRRAAIKQRDLFMLPYERLDPLSQSVLREIEREDACVG